jgi:chitodextrinase
MIASWNPNLFLYLADVYENGSYSEFENHYGTGTNYLSRLRDVTNPAVGNHEYGTPNASGYFEYWDNVPHYYSVDTAGWQIVSIDSTSSFDQMMPGTAQYEWLKQELQTDPNPCKLVFYHHPRFSATRGDDHDMHGLWGLLVDNGVDVVLNGHDHNYQRWAPLDRDGSPSPAGTTQFVAGTGGKSVYKFASTDPRMVKGFDTAPNGYGALRLDLGSAGLSYRYVNVNGSRLDHGSIGCTPGASDSTSPTMPTNVSASYSGGRVHVSWNESTDDVGITSYDIYRNGELLDSVGPQSDYFDAQVSPETTYDYTVRARDDAGNASEPGGPASVSTPPGIPPIFQDDFDHGNMSRWTINTNLVVQGAESFAGLAARGTSSGTPAYARKVLDTPVSDAYYATRFKVVSQVSDFVYMQRLKNASGGVIAGLFLTKNGEIGLRNQVAGLSFKSGAGLITPGWHDLQLHVNAAGASSLTEVWLDGEPVPALTRTESLGTTPIAQAEIGEVASGRTYDHAYDDVEVASAFVFREDEPPPPPPDDVTPPSAPAGLQASAVGSDRVQLSWQASTDDVSVAGYEIYRDGSLLATVGPTNGYDDMAVDPGASYEYYVKAFDQAGNVSDASNVATVSLPTALFSDDFESGNLSNWTSIRGASAQTAHVRSGSFGARVVYSGATGYARKNLGSDHNELFVSLPFKIVSKVDNTMYVSRLRTSSGAVVGGVLVDGQNRLGWRSDAAGITRKSAIVVSKGVWHDLQYHVVVNGTSSLTEVWYDGVKVDALTRTDSLGTVAVRTFQMGESGSGHDTAFDDLVVDSAAISP